MKKLKLTINGEVKTFDLPENGEYKCEVEDSYIPKVGDCVKVEYKNPKETSFYWLKIEKVVIERFYFSLAIEEDFNILKSGVFLINNNLIYTQITPEELKAKYAEAGYDWDYETDTIKPLKWEPKDGDGVWYYSPIYNPVYYIFDKQDRFLQRMLKTGLLFKTEAECKDFCNYCLKYFEK